MNPRYAYLKIPESYGQSLGGLAWSENGEAIEYIAPDPKIGLTFAMAGEVALFLAGFATVDALPCFGFGLHLLQFLGAGARHAGESPARRAERLTHLFRAVGRPHRNAGAFCAVLCRGLPRAAVPPDLDGLLVEIQSRRGVPMIREPLLFERPAEEPPLPPVEFEARVLKALDSFSGDEIEHWLRHGRGSVGAVGESVARLVPPTLTTILAGLESRPKFASAAPLIALLAGALTLPPRRLAPADLPTGGYADVSTRGNPEQLLPAQFALDDMEFLRRFAARELLYFQREEPHAPMAEDLVVLVDQGVRTWGDVRLALAASALALGRQAARRNIPFRLAATSNGGAIVDSLEAGTEALGLLLETSDLTPDPAAALARVLAAPSDDPRDVVLLTHPRGLTEPGVATAARRLTPGTRLFSVSIDGNGQVELAQVRQGIPVAVSRCRVELRPPVPRAARSAAAAQGSHWTGDVEPIGFPFRLGAFGQIDDQLFDFDESGEWLLLAGQNALLNLWRVDGTAAEMLPRPIFQGALPAAIHSVLGVTGGFVAIGVSGKGVCAAHYDLTSSTCRVHDLGRPFSSALCGFTYLRSCHSVVARVLSTGQASWALDLGREPGNGLYRPDDPAGAASGRPKTAFVLASHLPPPIPRFGMSERRMFSQQVDVQLDPTTGSLSTRGRLDGGEEWLPLRDGAAAWKGARIVLARRAGDTLAILVAQSSGAMDLALFSFQSRELIETIAVARDLKGFALARDGRRYAYRLGSRQLRVDDLGNSGPPRLETRKGKCHPNLNVALGAGYLAIEAGRLMHLVQWRRGTLDLVRRSGEDAQRLIAAEIPRLGPNSKAVARSGGPISYDRRFLRQASFGELQALVDGFGHVALLGRNEALVAVIFVFRDQFAAWLPDGTRIGPVPLIGGPETPGGAERIARALIDASRPRTEPFP